MSEQQTKAIDIAMNAHKGQSYGPGTPYHVHLSDVADVLREFGFGDNDDLMSAAWLHDVIEDTNETEKSLFVCGINIYTIALVDAVTDRPGRNRAERHAATLPRIARMPEAVTLKLADRIANVRACIANGDKRLEMYRKEFDRFQEALWRGYTEDNATLRMWTTLVSLMEEK